MLNKKYICIYMAVCVYIYLYIYIYVLIFLLIQNFVLFIKIKASKASFQCDILSSHCTLAGAQRCLCFDTMPVGP